MWDGGVQYDGLVHYITQDNWKKLEKILYYCIPETQELNKRELCLYFVNVIDECPEFHIFKLHFVLMHYLALTKMICIFVIRPKCSIRKSLGRIWQILKIESSNSFIQKGEGTLTLVFIYLRIWPRTSTYLSYFTTPQIIILASTWKWGGWQCAGVEYWFFIFEFEMIYFIYII